MIVPFVAVLAAVLASVVAVSAADPKPPKKATKAPSVDLSGWMAPNTVAYSNILASWAARSESFRKEADETCAKIIDGTATLDEMLSVRKWGGSVTNVLAVVMCLDALCADGGKASDDKQDAIGWLMASAAVFGVRNPVWDASYYSNAVVLIDGNISSGNYSALDAGGLKQYAKWFNQARLPSLREKVYGGLTSGRLTYDGMLGDICHFAAVLNKDFDEQAGWAIKAMHQASSRSDFEAGRNLLNDVGFRKAVRIARQAGRPTVNVVIAEHKALLDALKSGKGMSEALAALGWAWPGDWAAGVAEADAVIADVYAGVKVSPSAVDLVKIEVYKGTDGLKEFVEKYNKL
jgi:hypothetical protein